MSTTYSRGDEQRRIRLRGCCQPQQSKYYRWCHLGLMTLTYVIGELSHFLVGIVSRNMAQEIHYGDLGCVEGSNATSHVDCYTLTDKLSCQEESNYTCSWDYTGLGLQYQILAGPAFIGVFSVAGLVFGALADRHNRQRLLALSMLLLTTSTLLMGFAHQYWHLVVFRMLTAAGESGFAPLCVGMISDHFPAKLRGLAMSVFSYGVYFGYGISYLVGNYVTEALDWRWAYYVAAIPGGVVFCMHLLMEDPRSMQHVSTMLELSPVGDATAAPQPVDTEVKSPYGSVETTVNTATTRWQNVKNMVAENAEVFGRPSILLLWLGSCLRQSAGFCWSTNTQLYYQTYYPEADLGLWLSWVSIVGGSVGVTAGGVVSDWLVQRFGQDARIWVLAGSQLLATPFALGTLYFPPQGCFVSLLICYLFAEMWFGVVHAIVVELVPATLRSSAMAIFLFIINNVGGNMPLAVQGISSVASLREALYVLYPGMYFGSAVIFLVTAFALKRNQNIRQKRLASD